MNAQTPIKPSVDFLTITPALADQLLLLNTNNRPVRTGHVEDLARDMSEGRYQFNGDAIRIDRNDVLLDGQHRLMAIVASGKAQAMLVIRGLDPDTMKTIDSGTKRTTGDRFALNGLKNGNALAATLNLTSSPP